MRGLLRTGLVATLVAAVATTVVAALARAAGADLVVAEEEEGIPLSGIAFVTGVCCLVGLVLALGLRRWSAHPTARFLWTALTLTALSLVPPVLAPADAATTATLIALHLLAAAVMIPTLVRRLAREVSRASTPCRAAPAPRARRRPRPDPARRARA